MLAEGSSGSSKRSQWPSAHQDFLNSLRSRSPGRRCHLCLWSVPCLSRHSLLGCTLTENYNTQEAATKGSNFGAQKPSWEENIQSFHLSCMFLGHTAFLAFQQCFCQSETFYLKQWDCFQHALSCGTTGRGFLQSCSSLARLLPWFSTVVHTASKHRSKGESLKADSGNVCHIHFHNCKTGDTCYLSVLEKPVRKCFSAGSCYADIENLLPEVFFFIKWCLLIYTKLLMFSASKYHLFLHIFGRTFRLLLNV